MDKIDKLVEWGAERAFNLAGQGIGWSTTDEITRGYYRMLARVVYSHPDLALRIDVVKSYVRGGCPFKELHDKYIPLAEALKGKE